ncbi:hypothetical protein OCGS_0473 [Oceaniovalibus guishaninsula JLT2003]|uniref:CobE/GbiG C-terminal domain-containing protein n=1 Tax=Oceaniovalibus guishaninsula JLT2003 TaxID=1231392 RepID=K2HD50_9RHOB|nr:cobalamin biosynthesis protein [Oceaniovalibus guishaninsula]EKE45383.1 hypothetical protein OCGS_0473 [Oceaniovalibus guishaninsula JLT2003]
MIVAGFGFRSGAGVACLADALARAGGAPDRLATAAAKVRAPAIRALAERLDLPLIGVDAADLAAQETLTHGAASRAAHGTGSVAEAAALAAAGRGARLTGPRAVSQSGRATCALAEGDGT